MLIKLLTLISTYMHNIIWILLVHHLFLAANVCKYTVRYAVRLPYCKCSKPHLTTEIYRTRWLPGFARVPNYAPSPCHMHPVHNCHHIKSYHPPVKQCDVITTHHNTEFIILYYTHSTLVVAIPKSQAHGPRCGLFCALYTVYWPVSSSGYLP